MGFSIFESRLQKSRDRRVGARGLQDFASILLRLQVRCAQRVGFCNQLSIFDLRFETERRLRRRRRLMRIVLIWFHLVPFVRFGGLGLSNPVGSCKKLQEAVNCGSSLRCGMGRRSDAAGDLLNVVTHKCVISLLSIWETIGKFRQGVEIIAPLYIRGSENQKLLMAGKVGQRQRGQQMRKVTEVHRPAVATHAVTTIQRSAEKHVLGADENGGSLWVDVPIAGVFAAHENYW